MEWSAAGGSRLRFGCCRAMLLCERLQCVCVCAACDVRRDVKLCAVGALGAGAEVNTV